MRMVLVYTTLPDMAEVERIVSTCMKRALAACANYTEIRSMYVWKGELADDREVGVLFKTLPERRDGLVAALKEMHPYETPAIIEIPAESLHDGYSHWMRDSCGAGDR